MNHKRIFNHRQIWQLALPMIIANISTPLLGLVDTAVMGHLDEPVFLGGVAIGGLIFSFIYWGLGFLRMGTTGLTARAYGLCDNDEIKAILARAVILALIFASIILLFQKPLMQFSFWLIASSPDVEQLAGEYFSTRIWSSPATLCLYVLSGWFLGMQNVSSPLIIVLTTNLCNIALDLLFVLHLQMDIVGVALASVLAEYTGLLLGLLLLNKQLKKYPGGWQWSKILTPHQLKAMLIINNNIFIRTLCLIFAFAFFTARGAQFGNLILAANAVLINFQTFMAYALDGFAHAAEALVGRALGAQDKKLYRQSVITAALWSFIIAVCFSMTYGAFGVHIINLMSNLESVRLTAYQYLPWVIVLPLFSFVSFLFDGIFIGANLSREMRNTMIFSLFFCFLPAWYFTQHLKNHGLWLALAIFMVARGVSMAWVYYNRKL